MQQWLRTQKYSTIFFSIKLQIQLALLQINRRKAFFGMKINLADIILYVILGNEKIKSKH